MATSSPRFLPNGVRLEIEEELRQHRRGQWSVRRRATPARVDLSRVGGPRTGPRHAFNRLVGGTYSYV